MGTRQSGNHGRFLDALRAIRESPLHGMLRFVQCTQKDMQEGLRKNESEKI